MGTAITVIIIILVIVVILALIGLSSYNGFVKSRNLIQESWRQIDVELNRRYELIPNLVDVVKGYMRHERETLDAVIKARNSAMAAEQKVAANPSDPAAVGELNRAEAQLGGVLGRLIALSEAYPDLKANQNFLSLQEELTATEGRVAYARQFYNDSVLGYNTKIQSFPAVILAGAMKFTEREYFEAEEGAREAPRVQF